MESTPTMPGPRPDTPVVTPPPVAEAAPVAPALAPRPSESLVAATPPTEVASPMRDAFPPVPTQELPSPAGKEALVPLEQLMLAEISALEEKNARRYEGALCFGLGEGPSRTLVFPEPQFTGDTQHPQEAEYLAMTPGGFKTFQFDFSIDPNLQENVRFIMESSAMGRHDYFDRSNTPTGYQNDSEHGETVTFAPDIFLREKKGADNWGAGKLITSVDPSRTRQLIEGNKKRAEEIVAYRKRDREEQHKRQDTWNRESVAVLQELV